MLYEDAIRKDSGLTADELQEIRAQKAERRGSFDEEKVLERDEE